MKPQDLYHQVTQQIIEQLERGVKPWICPWQREVGEGGLPINGAMNTPYSGINIIQLWVRAQMSGFASRRWYTYRQAKGLGGQVRRGEQGTRVVFYSTREVIDRDTGEPKDLPVMRWFTVFNGDQIEGIEDPASIPLVPAGFDPIEWAEDLMRESGAVIHEGGSQAYYRLSTDSIQLPDRARFSTAADFYATALHELVHWTAHPNRLNRPLATGERSVYAFEELVAELGAAFLMADLGIEGEVQHESYIADWLSALKQDTRLIFKAASKASAAHGYLMLKLVTEASSREEAA